MSQISSWFKLIYIEQWFLAWMLSSPVKTIRFYCHEHLCQIVAMSYQKYQVVSGFYIVETSSQTAVSGLAAILQSCPNILSHIQLCHQQGWKTSKRHVKNVRWFHPFKKKWQTVVSGLAAILQTLPKVYKKMWFCSANNTDGKLSSLKLKLSSGFKLEKLCQTVVSGLADLTSSSPNMSLKISGFIITNEKFQCDVKNQLIVSGFTLTNVETSSWTVVSGLENISPSWTTVTS